jgi:hypothetical protein
MQQLSHFQLVNNINNKNEFPKYQAWKQNKEDSAVRIEEWWKDDPKNMQESPVIENCEYFYDWLT